MFFIVLFFILILLVLLCKNKKVFGKFKLFFKKCKWLLVLELVILIALGFWYIFDERVAVKEMDPHALNKVIRCEILKEGEEYTYNTIKMYQDTSGEGFSEITHEEISNIVKIENVDISEVKVLVNEEEKNYKYGSGFSYYGVASCSCGTPIVFEKALTTIVKIGIFCSIAINLFVIIFIKDKKIDNSDSENL